MSLAYLLDTNVVSEPLRPAPNQQVLDRLKRYEDEIALAAVVWHELLFGAYRLPPSARRSATERYLIQVIALTIPILSYDNRAAQWHTAERTRLASLGKTPPFAYGQIAAIARVNHLILVTANTADFVLFQDIQLEDWSSPS